MKPDQFQRHLEKKKRRWEVYKKKEEHLRDQYLRWQSRYSRDPVKDCDPRAWGRRGPWGNLPQRPRRHWFFLKIFMLLFWVCVVSLIISCFTGSGFSLQKVPHYLGWSFLILFIGFFFLRRMFSPLRWLMMGVQEIAEGNLDFQFPTHKHHHGEIGYLTENFNLMVQRVKEMVHSKDQLLLDVSHELRSPLTRLKVALEMTPDSEMKDSMLQDAAEMETMLTEILETQRLRNGNGKLSLEEVDLSELAGELAPKYKNRKPGLRLVFHGSLKVQADRNRIKTVFQNLVENGLKYSDKQKKPVEIAGEKKEGRVFITVRDFGVGIPPQDQEKIFEPFYRVDKSRTKETGGYGLGLSLCREIMIAHGGEITIQSQPGQGTVFSLAFSGE